eukprot:CAMPEP_0202342448 /NCGR_PEP_ID=MMETSP1126-20121109/3006_1 /ASSEMBLY_ACC=CAM_ASM_000457 /TAXON_ID=3047 /ORGANISM="Dunaliella tertiolecta, Strain CCMP1320" /LENGTH=474 /DNA_ID=CAMNT_0048933401 /DNA_START=1018 /DNA_END=2442 /DNA_ORIENTATION=+
MQTFLWVVWGGLLFSSLTTTHAQDIPHISQCSLCFDCAIGGDPPGGGDPNQQAGRSANRYSSLDPPNKRSLPTCDRCYGCNTHLQRIDGASTHFNVTYKPEEGASSTWTFKATTNRTASKEAVVKVYCLPVSKNTLQLQSSGCATSHVMRNVQLNMAMDQVASDCGFHDIVPRVWLDRVEGIVPDVGYHVHWFGLWQELVNGVSMENFLQKGKPTRVPPPQVVDYFMNKLNKTQVVRAAIFDLLTSQCDRHAQNLIVDETGNLKLIDNEICLAYSWPHCAFDSVLIPTTQKQEIARMGNHYIQKSASATPAHATRGRADPQMLLDYRCYMGEQDQMGTNYPPQVTQCLQKISSMSPEQVQAHYNLPELRPAKNLHSRASDMLNKGFEWAYKYGEPKNFKSRTYMVQPKCCQVQWVSGQYRCAHDWPVKYELPKGDPSGRPWMKNYPDMGTYEGHPDGPEGTATARKQTRKSLRS